MVNEVKVAQTARRDKMTRLRLARMLAAAMLGSVLLASSAVGVTLASALSPDEQRPAIAPYEGRQRGHARAAMASGRATSKKVMRRLKIGSGYVLLTAPEFRKLSRLTDGEQVDLAELTDLIPLLPPALAARVQEAIDTTTATVASAVSDVPETADVRLQRETTKEKDPAKEAQPPAEAEETEKPAEPEPTPEDPEPTPSDGDGEERDGDGGDLPEPDDVLLGDDESE